MRLLVLTKYSPIAASSRYRILQYAPYFEKAGWRVDFKPLLPDDYLISLYRDGRRSNALIAASVASRLAYLLRCGLADYDAAFVQYELFPSLPFWVEAPYFGGRCGIVVDYDDAIHVAYEANALLRDKIPAVIRAADQVVVGNEFLHGYARAYTRRATLIPTVVDPSVYLARSSYAPEANQPLVIGWIGTPITVRFLSAMADVLRTLSDRFNIEVHAVGAPAGFAIPGVNVSPVPWSENAEAALIRNFDIGIMPLLDEKFTQGKCGLKLIQYMACGTPCVGSAIGANRYIICDGVNGFLAATAHEFASKLRLLAANPELRRRIGLAGRATVEQRYSLQSRAPELLRVVEQAASLARRRRSMWAA